MHWKDRFSSAVLMVTLAAMLSACTVSGAPRKETRAKPKPAVPAGGVLLQGAGATFPSVLYDKWFSTYQASHPQDPITYEPVGSGEGIRRFIAQNVGEEEKIDFGASDAAMRDDEMAKVPKGAILLPVTAGSVALAYNLPDVKDLKLSRNAIAGIFLGQIKSWNDPTIAKANPGVKLPKLTITTVVRQDGSGTTFAFTKHLDAISDAWRSQFGAATLVNWPGNSMRAKGNEGVAARIEQSVGSIGYVSYEFARRIGLKVAWLENHAGKYVTPSEVSSTAALAGAVLPENMRLYVPDPTGDAAYPMVTLTWILLYKNYAEPQKAQALEDLFRWCLTDGQKFAPELGYTPLPENIVSRSLAALKAIQSSGS